MSIATRRRAFAAIAALLISTSHPARAADQPQFGQAWSRNMVSAERGLPETFDPKTGANVKWVADLGSESYATPVVAGGRVLIGTNNERPRDPKHAGDRAVLLCLDEKDGKLLWQLVVAKLSEDEKDRYLDWPKAGFCSEPTVEGDRAYAMTNRGEVVCLDMKGMANGNDGPYLDEAVHMVPRGHSPVAPGPADADILWVCDLVSQAGIRTHDQVRGSVLVRGDLLYVNSANGVDNTHRVIRKPDAPSLVVIDKRTGRLVARDGLHLGPTTFHCAWSSPSLGEVGGRSLLFFGGPDGICYALEPLGTSAPAEDAPLASLKDVWRYDPDPTAPKRDVHQWISNRQESPSVIMGMPVFVDGRIYLTAGGDLWWGKRQAWLKCIDAGGAGDVTKTAERWSYALSREACGTPAIHDGLAYVGDCGGVVHCVDAETGQPVWTQKAVGDIWASAFVADGKVYIATRRGHFVVMKAGRTATVLADVDLGVADAISATPVAANGVLYISTARRIFALERRP
jgi:outer membrane protein assembly factor BamB